MGNWCESWSGGKWIQSNITINTFFLQIKLIIVSNLTIYIGCWNKSTDKWGIKSVAGSIIGNSLMYLHWN